MGGIKISRQFSRDFFTEFDKERLSDKRTHPQAINKTNNNGQLIEVLSMGDRIVALEGAIIQLKEKVEELEKEEKITKV